MRYGPICAFWSILSLVALLPVATAGEWEELSAAELYANTTNIVVGTLGDDVTEAGDGWMRASLKPTDTLYSARGGRVSGAMLYFRTEEIPGKAVKHEAGKAGIWLLHHDSRRTMANHPQRFRPMEDVDAVRTEVLAWLDAEMQAGLERVAEGLKQDPDLRTEALRDEIQVYIRRPRRNVSSTKGPTGEPAWRASARCSASNSVRW